MFGVLKFDNRNHGTLLFTASLDPIAAVSRNLQAKLHIACTSCRSKKARCSGGEPKCQRCTSSGLECVYPPSLGRTRRQGSGERAEGGASQAVYNQDRTSSSATEDQENLSDDMILDSFYDYTFNTNSIDDSLFSAWIMDTPIQLGLDTGSSPRSSSHANFSVESKSSPSNLVIPRSPSHEVSTTNTSSFGPSATNNAIDMAFQSKNAIACGEILWAPINSDEYCTPISLIPEMKSPDLEPSRPSTASENCSCLLSAMSFLERLVFKSAAHKHRIDHLLADAHKAIKTLSSFVACKKCASRVEQTMLLAMAARQISGICVKLASCYKTMLGGDAKQTHEVEAFDVPVDISVSSYRVSRRENLHLLKSLVTFQLGEFQQQLNTLKSRNRNWPEQEQVEALVEAENQIKSARVAMDDCSR